MSDINITVDSSQIVGGKQAIDDFGASFGKLVDRILREQRQIDRAMKAPWEVQEKAIDTVINKLQEAATVSARENQKIVNANLGVTNSYKSAKESAEAFVEVLRNQERIAQQSTASLNQRLGVTGPAAIQGGASFSAMEAEIERLSQKYNQVYAASTLYESSLNELNQAHLLGVINAKQHEAAVESLNMEFQAFQAGTAGFGNRFAEQNQMAASSANQMGVVVQQAGYQVGDFLVQVQSGTNWMVAFGQQATQLVGTLPLLADSLGVGAGRLIAISTGLGIAIPLITALGAAWMRTSEGTNAAASSVETLDQKLKSLDQTVQEWVLTKQAAQSGMTVEEFTGTQGIEQALENMRVAEEAYNALVERIVTQPVTGLTAGSGAGMAIVNLFALGSTQSDMAQALENYQNAVRIVAGIRQKEASERRAAFIEERNSLEENSRLELLKARYGEDSIRVKDLLAQRERRLYEEGFRTKGMSELQLRALMNIYDEGVRITRQTQAWNTIVETVKSKLESIDGMQLDVGLSIKTFWDGVPDIVKDFLGGTGSPLAPKTSPRSRPAPALLGEPEVSGSGSGSSGGGSGGNGRLESLVAELQTERETLELWYEESRVLLEDATAAELELLGGKNEAKLRLEEEYQSRLKEILGQEKNYRLSEMGDMFGSLADLAGVGGKKMLRVQATLSAAATTIAAYETAVKAAAEAKTLPGRIAAYAKFLAVGLGAVSKIKSAGGIGGGGGGGGGGGPSTSTVAPAESAQPQTVFIDNIDPNSFYTGEALIRLFEAFYSENDKRGKVFVVRS